MILHPGSTKSSVAKEEQSMGNNLLDVCLGLDSARLLL